jgi:preprotein translocase subunit YajC
MIVRDGDRESRSRQEIPGDKNWAGWRAGCGPGRASGNEDRLGRRVLLPVLMIGVVYLMMIRPQQKKQKLWTQMLSDLKTGDRITTTGGIRGTIISLKDDALIMRVAPDGIKMEVVKSAIASVTTQEEGSK